MNNRLKIWLFGGVLAGAATMSVTGWAMGPPGVMGPDPARMLEHISDRLELSATQRSAIESLLVAVRETSATDRARMRQLRDELAAMQDGFDEATARTIADEIGQITSRMVYQASATWSQVYQLLNAGQRAQLDEMIAHREEHRSRWQRDGDSEAP